MIFNMYLKNLIVKWYIEVAKSYIFGVKVTNLFLKRADVNGQHA